MWSDDDAATWEPTEADFLSLRVLHETRNAVVHSRASMTPNLQEALAAAGRPRPILGEHVDLGTERVSQFAGLVYNVGYHLRVVGVKALFE